MVRQFGGSIGYFNLAGDAERTIEGIVERGTFEVISETGDVTSQAVIVKVQNDSTLGISATEIDTGGDELNVALRAGGAAERRAIVRILSDNGGLVRFLCQ